jgi:hypothetical protein
MPSLSHPFQTQAATIVAACFTPLKASLTVVSKKGIINQSFGKITVLFAE